MAEIVGLMDDLFFQMKVLETAKQLGLQFKVANTADSLMELVATSPKLVIVDLNARSGAIPAIERVRREANGVRLVGFLSHVQVDLAEQARAAGCDEVMPRAEFTQKLGQILSSAKEEEFAFAKDGIGDSAGRVVFDGGFGSSMGARVVATTEQHW